MRTGLARNWWMLAIRGVLALLFGVLVFLWPGLAWAAVVLMFAAYAFLDGAVAIAAAVVGHERGARWWALALEGVVGLAAGVLTLAWPEVTALVLLYLIGFWAVFTGVLEIIVAVRLRKDIEGEWALGLAGLLSVAMGLAVLLFPGAGALAVAWLIGLYAVLFGATLLALAFRLRGRHRVSTSAGAVV
ncbi:MAG TPA: HdeD family acid-resistance protein [Gemmata sp.]